MTIHLIVDNITVPVKHIRFSDGTSNVKLEIPGSLVKYPPTAYYSISVDPTTKGDDYLWEIYLVLDALHRTFKDDGKLRRLLYIPYLAHARADRVFEVGNAFPLNLFMKHLILQFDEIFLTDPHSSWCEEHLPPEMLNIKYQHQCFIETVKDIKSGDILISPDKGATQKIYKLQQALDYRMVATKVIEASKERDIETGRVIGTSLPDIDLSGKVCWIVDDISDGNGTFVPLAQKLREAGAKEVNLYVTHLIAAKGLGNLFGIINKLYNYQVVGNYINMEDVRNFNAGIEPRKF
jgi:phosphoribosylpyrophosphate synthetase